MRNLLCVALLLVLASGKLFGQSAPPASPARPPTTVDISAQLQVEVMRAFAQKNWDQAAQLSNRLIEADPESPDGYYNFACALARMGKNDDALDNLATAVGLGFLNSGHIEADEDLASLHKDKRFAAVVASARKREKTAPFEKGPEINGVKTMDEFPDGGLRYRLRMSPDATIQKPNRLLIWLHPAGLSGDKVIEQLAPRFLKQNFALVVLTRKQYGGWTIEEGNLLMKGTLPALAQIPGIDANKPVLMGCNNGGQMALELYYQNPGSLGGLVLDSAYPLGKPHEMQSATQPDSTTRHIEIPVHPLPDDPAIKDVPLFVLVGGDDAYAPIWKTIAPFWQKDGVPLTITIIPKTPAAWHLGHEQLKLLDTWLSQVAAGQKPSATLPTTQPTN